MMIIEGIEFWGVRILGGDPGAQEGGHRSEREREGGGGFGEKESGLAFVCLAFILCVFYLGEILQ